MTAAAPELTPLLKQFHDLKQQVPDALLLFRMGDFYELFGDDAVEAARILEITLTSRDKGKENPLPMAGVPHHSVGGYIQKLLKAGRKVAIGEQMEDPAAVRGKSIVRREITRVLSPGIRFEAEGAENHFLAALVREPAARDRYAIALVDAATGETRAGGGLDAETVERALRRAPVRHVIQPGGRALPTALAPLLAELGAGGALIETLAENALGADPARALLERLYGVADLGALNAGPGGAHALGLALQYVLRCQRTDSLPHLRFPRALEEADALTLGPGAAAHLDLLPDEDQPGASLLARIQRTRTAMGARRLRRWLLAPLRSPAAIAERQGAVRFLADAPAPDRDHRAAALTEVYDLDRLAGRVSAGLASPRDLRALGVSLVASERVFATLAPDSPSADLARLRRRGTEALAGLGELGSRLERELREDAPMTARDGGIFRPGFHAELDRLLQLAENGQKFLVELEARERAATGIPNLKIRYNRVFGYYIEVSQAHAAKAPAHYQRKQTTAGGERFFTEELKKLEDELVGAEARQRALEAELFRDLLGAARARLAELGELSDALASLDALVSLAELAREPGWTFPVVDDSLELEILGGRHPVLEARARGAFVPNDTRLDAAGRLLILTGPNMGGKSTLMRQVSLIVILGQAGAPVPATSARWGWVSSVGTRIGAQDAISRGQSTFMVEMTELAHLLHHSDERALIVLDEIGRGTSTYDGLSVAGAALEWIVQEIRARTLFATHYHELTALGARLPGVANAHLAVSTEAGGRLRFLYELREGPTSESFGVQVARLAGLPAPVVRRAQQLLAQLEAGRDSRGAADPDQLSLFGAAPVDGPDASPAAEPSPESLAGLQAREGLLRLDPDRLTPLEALNALARLRSDLTASESARAAVATP